MDKVYETYDFYPVIIKSNEHIFYVLARFLMLGVLPFVSISFLNYKIWLVVRQRRRSGRRVAEDNLSVLLMTIVASFLICNSPRIFLNMHEITVIKEIYVCRSD